MMSRLTETRLPVAVASVIGFVLAWPSIARAQCAMCGAAAASSSGVARGLAFSILFLLGTLFLVVGWLVVLVLRSRVPAPDTLDGAAPGASSIDPAPLPTGHAPAQR
jgi:hypothetical protein